MTVSQATSTAENVWAAPTGSPAAGPVDVIPDRPTWRTRLREDVLAFLSIVALTVLLGAPAGLLWSAIAPRFTVVRQDGELSLPNIESTKAFIGADGTYVVIVLALGLVCGALAWRFARRHGPATILGLTVGGLLAALVAAAVGLRPGASEAVQSLRDTTKGSGSFDLFLGARNQTTGDFSLRAAWAPVVWPVASLIAFLTPAWRAGDDLD